MRTRTRNLVVEDGVAAEVEAEDVVVAQVLVAVAKKARVLR